MKSLKPKRLSPGDTIAVVSPASPSLTTSHEKRGIEALVRMGYRVKTGKHVHDRHLLFAGTMRDRAGDINAAFGDDSVRAIICLRGGCGTSQILPYIDYSLIKKNPKILVGYSDITVLQVAVFNATGLITFYGPMVASDFGKGSTPFKVTNLFRLLTQTQGTTELKNHPARNIITLHPGLAEGRLAGGCLSVLVSTIGTRYEVDTRDKILFLEDVDEKPHRVDRYLGQLIDSGKFEKARGVIFGAFTRCEYVSRDNYFKFGVTLLDMIRERITPLGIPAVYGLQFGHVANKLTIPFGAYATLDATNCRILVESCVA